MFARHERMAARLRAWAADRGFSLLGSGMGERSPTLTALRVPDGVEPAALRAGVRARDIEIAVGLGPYRDSCVRVGHMGDIRMPDIERTIEAMESVLASGGPGGCGGAG